jgi:hypothetical protein
MKMLLWKTVGKVKYFQALVGLFNFHQECIKVIFSETKFLISILLPGDGWHVVAGGEKEVVVLLVV